MHSLLLKTNPNLIIIVGYKKRNLTKPLVCRLQLHKIKNNFLKNVVGNIFFNIFVNLFCTIEFKFGAYDFIHVYNTIQIYCF